MKDSASYLDHINGKKRELCCCVYFCQFHSFLKIISDQRALGFSMRVERADVDAVKRRLDDLRQKVVQSKAREAIVVTKESTFDDYENKLNVQLMEQEARKKRKRDEAIEAKKKQHQATTEEEQDEVEGGEDIAAMMGFQGFGTSKR